MRPAGLTAAPPDASTTLPALSSVLKPFRVMPPPLIMRGFVTGASANSLSSTSNPAVLRVAVEATETVPRAASRPGFAAPDVFAFSRVARNGEIVDAFSEIVPPAASRVPPIVTFAPVRLMPPSTGAFNVTPAGTVILPSPLFTRTAPNPPVLNKAGDSSTCESLSAASGSGAPLLSRANSPAAGSVPLFTNVMAGGVGDSA